MDVIRKENDNIEFQFKIVDGVIDNSYATYTALKMGIPKKIVDRADEVFLLILNMAPSFYLSK